MSLPDLIEIILAALADGEVTLTGALWSEDTQVMTEALRTLGFEVRVAPDPEEFCNRTITVKGLGGKIPNAGTPEKPLELFVGNAGTAARFLAAMICLGQGTYRLSGVPRMHERPQAALFKALRELGYRVDSANDKLPATIHGVGWKPGETRVPLAESSQFASALLLGAKVGGWKIKVSEDDFEEAPYVKMTERLIESFPKHGGRFHIEPDASSGSYLWAARWLITNDEMRDFTRFLTGQQNTTRMHLTYGADGLPCGAGSSLGIANWPESGWQVDAEFPQFLPLPDEVSREGQLW
jgi:3-phosphoshikimate 1-carboxyvinyltransferase